MCKPAVFLSRLEFSVMLMAGKVKMIQCFALPEAENVDRREMTRAVHELIAKGFLMIKETGPCLSPEAAQMVECIKNSKQYLFIEPGDEYEPQRIVYLGPQAVVLENTTEINPDFRLFMKEGKELWTWVEEVFGLPDPAAESKEEAWKLAELSRIAEDEWKQLQNQVKPEKSLGIRFWLEKLRKELGNAPLVGIRLIHEKKATAHEDLIVYPGSMNMWYLRSREDSLEVVPDSVETREEIKELLGREAE